MTKNDLFNTGVEIAKEFLTLNNLEIPNFHNADLPHVWKGRENYFSMVLEAGRTCGYYRPLTGAVISPSRSANIATENQVRLYSYPASKIDRTPVGVVAHEIGHHLDHVFKYPSMTNPKFKDVIKPWAVSGYEPNPAESFAETARLFILNPNLLKCAIPKRFDFFAVELGLKPLHDRPWTEVLEHAPPRILKALHNWV